MAKRSTAYQCTICLTYFDAGGMRKSKVLAQKCESLGKPDFKFKRGNTFEARIPKDSLILSGNSFTALLRILDFEDFRQKANKEGQPLKQTWIIVGQFVKRVHIRRRHGVIPTHTPWYRIQNDTRDRIWEISELDLIHALKETGMEARKTK